MTGIEVHGKVRRVGNSLAVLIPAKQAREAGLHEGDPVTGTLQKDIPDVLGIVKGIVPYEPFSRRDLYDDD